MRTFAHALAVAALAGFLPVATGAAQRCTEDAMIVFDGSGSMSDIAGTQIGVRRITEARQALRHVLPGIASVRRLGLVVYGPRGDRTCRNADLIFGPEWNAAPRIVAEVDTLRPAGGTPLTRSVRMAAEALEYRSAPGTVVLVTDGRETCGGSPCGLAAELAAQAPGLTVHVIGFRVMGGDRRFVARCLADRTGGLYLEADSVAQLVGALRVTMSCNVLGQGSLMQERRPG